MNLKDLALPALILGALALASRVSSGSSTPPPSGGTGYVQYYPATTYHTPLPVIPSEPGVSEGIPSVYDTLLCPNLTPQPRYPSDEQECCQCPRGHIQCGNPDSMEKLMLGTAPEDFAWRQGFCL